jgi:ribonuclease HI
MIIQIYTDGSNNLKDKTGGIGIYFTRNNIEWYTVSEPYTYDEHITNNSCELFAILRALEILYENDYSQKTVCLYSDSQYSVNALTEWWKRWKQCNWKLSSGEPVKNLQLIQDILSLMKQFTDISIFHVGNHSHKIPPKDCTDYAWIGNYNADKLATIGRKLYQPMSTKP